MSNTDKLIDNIRKHWVKRGFRAPEVLATKTGEIKSNMVNGFPPRRNPKLNLFIKEVPVSRRRPAASASENNSRIHKEASSLGTTVDYKNLSAGHCGEMTLTAGYFLVGKHGNAIRFS